MLTASRRAWDSEGLIARAVAVESATAALLRIERRDDSMEREVVVRGVWLDGIVNADTLHKVRMLTRGDNFIFLSVFKK